MCITKQNYPMTACAICEIDTVRMLLAMKLWQRNLDAGFQQRGIFVLTEPVKTLFELEKKMKSKVQEAKDAQGYTQKAIKCSFCIHYESEFVEITNKWHETFKVERGRRCGIGKFAVNSSAVCNLFVRKHV